MTTWLVLLLLAAAILAASGWWGHAHYVTPTAGTGGIHRRLLQLAEDSPGGGSVTGYFRSGFRGVEHKVVEYVYDGAGQFSVHFDRDGWTADELVEIQRTVTSLPLALQGDAVADSNSLRIRGLDGSRAAQLSRMALLSVDAWSEVRWRSASLENPW